jgi:hypothetical protein
LKSADDAKEEFEEMASIGDEVPFIYRAFTVHDYEMTEMEIVDAARSSWIKFKQSSKHIVLVRFQHVVR